MLFPSGFHDKKHKAFLNTLNEMCIMQQQSNNFD